MQPKIENWDTISARCMFVNRVDHKLNNQQAPTDDEIRKLTYFAFNFGNDGRKRLLTNTIKADIESSVIDQIWSQIGAEQNDDSSLCDRLCGKHGHCELMKVIRKGSPLSLPIEKPEKFDESYAVNLFEKYNGKDVVYHKNTHTFYEYRDGVWVKMPEEKLGMVIETLLMTIYPTDQVNIQKVNSVSNRIKVRSRLFFEEDFNSNKLILNLKNGLFDLRAFKLIPHNKEYKTTVQFPVEYDPKATCSLFDRKLNEIFDNDQEVIDHFLKWMMYTLLPTYEHQKALLLLGKGGNGKSVLMDVWNALLGQDNCSNQELSNLSSDRHYSVFQLVNKYVNFSKEVSTLEKETNIFKSLTGNDLMSARQIYKKPVDFRNIARLIISANQLPNFKVIDKAILRRFDIIKFEKRFDLNADTQLNIKLIKELPGILNRVLSKSKDIIHSDESIYFEAPESVKKNMLLFNESSSSVAEFVDEMCVVSSVEETDHATTLKSLYDSYMEWCGKLNGVTPKSRSIFKDELETLFNCSTYQISSVKALSGLVYKNIHWVIGIRLLSSNQDTTALAESLKKKIGLTPTLLAS